MSEVQRGDMSAYQELIRRYQRKVYRVISGYHRDADDVLEILQDTFLKVYMARATWQRRTSFAAWLYRIAINASIDHHRRRGRTRADSLEDVPELRLSQAAGVSHTPVDRLEQGERRRLLETAIRRLPVRQREVISLRYFGEMSLEEIAETLDCPLGTVKSNLHKAVQNLKGLLWDQKETLGYGFV